jgi:hypothetical protein
VFGSQFGIRLSRCISKLEKFRLVLVTLFKTLHINVSVFDYWSFYVFDALLNFDNFRENRIIPVPGSPRREPSHGH